MGSSSGVNPGALAANMTAGAAAGGFNGAAGLPPPKPTNFAPKTRRMSGAQGGTIIPMGPDTGSTIDTGNNAPDIQPNFNVPTSQPMPQLYNGTNAQIPQLKKGILPFYGS